jgi:hypothetical protein
MSVPEAQKLFAIMLPAPGLLPEFRRLDHGKKNLLGTGPVHFFTDDLLNLSDDPVTQGEIAVNPGRQFSDHPRSEHELMTDDFGI